MLASYYQVLKELIAMKSISVHTEYIHDIEKTSMYLNTMLQDNDFDSEIIHGYGNPVVLWKYIVDVSLPTMLVYGNYDVQSADIGEWRNHDPFSLYITQDKIYGRGVAHNKWQFLIHLLTIFSLIETKKLGYNVIVLLEGNKETWSPYIEQFVHDYRQELVSDFFLVSDSCIVWNAPCIDVWYRWWIHLTLHIKTANTDLHSWLYGGVVPNAIHEMNKILSKLYDGTNKITIPYFYYDVEDVPFDVIVQHKKVQINEQKLLDDFWLKTFLKDKKFDFLTQIGLMPTIQVTWIDAGYTRDEYKNTIPHQALAHINFRIVKNQNTKNTLAAFDQWLQTTLPEYITYDLNILSLYEPIKIDSNNFYIKKAEAVLSSVFSQTVFYKYSWAGSPIVEVVERIINAKPVLIPFTNQDCNVHGVNENFDIELIEKWFQFSYEFFKK